jgi:hypothetical protein
MYTKKLYKILGILSILFGAIAIACLFKPVLMPIAMPFIMLGFAASGYNIYLNNKYEFDEVKWPLGYVGMFVNSLPIIFLLVLIFKYR